MIPLKWKVLICQFRSDSSNGCCRCCFSSECSIIRERILGIQKTELFHSRNYFKIYDALALMKNKTITLINENSKGPKGINTVNSTLELTTSLLKETLAFLTKSTTDRQVGSGRFFSKIHNKLNAAFFCCFGTN